MTTKWIRNILKSYEQSRNEENDDNINRNSEYKNYVNQ